MKILGPTINLSVSAKISLGFAVVLILHIVIAAMNHAGLRKSQQDFQAYNRIQSDALVIQGIDRNVAELQRNVLLYTYTGHSGPEHRVKQLHQELAKRLDKADKTDRSKADREAIRVMREHLKAYIEHFEAVSIDRQRRYELAHDVMSPLREKASRLLHQVASSANRDSRVAVLASHADENLLLADAEATRYRQDLDSKEIKNAKDHIAAAALAVRQIIAISTGDQPKKEVKETLDLIVAYEKALVEMIQATRSYLHLVNVVMTGEAVEFSYLTTELNASTIKRVDALSQEMAGSADRYLWISNIVSVITIIAGLIAAWAIGRNIVPPLKRITSTLVDLANGDHDAEVPMLSRQDEIGRMASAAEVFKQRAAETQQLLERSERLSAERNEANQQLQNEISSRRKIQEDLVNSNSELSQKSAEMEQFTYSASHDLKSPLVSCSGLIKCIFEDIESKNYDEVKDSAERIQKNITRMENCINDLLELSRVGRIRHDPELIAPNTIMTDLAIDLKERLGGAGAHLAVQEDMPSVVADRIRLIEIFDNLITNAIKYGCSEPGKTIHVGSVTRDGELLYFVRDEGPGIAKQFHDKIFALFQRLHRAEEGSGVGLTIVARIMEIHGGRAWVESEEGEGATFWVAFPIKTV